MGVSVMVLGVSGTGKSCSMRNFGKDEIALANVAGKPLPFRGTFTDILNTDDYEDIKKFMKKTKKKSIVIDDAQYLMGDEFMRRVTERGYDKFSEMAFNFYDLLKEIQSLPDDKIVYMLGHIERDQDGNEKFKTMGKLIDQCINVEGTCTIVLKTAVSDGKFYFITQNSGHDTVKSPMGMFSSAAIDNDLKYVDDKIRNYFGMTGAKTDDEIKADDAEKAVSEDEVSTKRRKRHKPEDDAVEQPQKSKTEDKTYDRGTATENMYFYNQDNDSYSMIYKGDNIPADDRMVSISRDDFNTGCKRKEDQKKEAAAKVHDKAGDVVEKTMEKVDKIAGDREEVPFEEVETAMNKTEPRHSRRTHKEEPADEPKEEAKEKTIVDNQAVPDEPETPAQESKKDQAEDQDQPESKPQRRQRRHRA